MTDWEASPEYSQTVRLFHSMDLTVGQRGLFFLGRIPLDHEALQAGELEMGHHIPEGFSYHNHCSLVGAFRFRVACVLARTQFVIARSEATWRSRTLNDIYPGNGIAAPALGAGSQ